MFEIVLVAPQIAPNTGNVIRLAANTGCRLHLVEPLGFRMDDRRLRRAGLDYHECAQVRCHADWAALRHEAESAQTSLYAFTTRGTQPLGAAAFRPGDWLVFGNETAGLPDEVLASMAPRCLVRLPMRPAQRSLNLSNAVAVAVFEAWRQQGYAGGQ